MTTAPRADHGRPTAGPVVLWGLPAPCAHRLREVLLQAGHASVVVHPGHHRPLVAPPRGGHTTVVVASAEVIHGRGDPGSVDGAAVALVALVPDAGTETFVAMVRRGAAGVLDGGAAPGHVAQVFAAAAAGMVVMPDGVTQVLTGGRPRTGVPALSEPERSWLRWLGGGGVTSTLAARTFCSEREMYRLLGALYARMGASGRTEALLAAERWGLLDA